MVVENFVCFPVRKIQGGDGGWGGGWNCSLLSAQLSWREKFNALNCPLAESKDKLFSH